MANSIQILGKVVVTGDIRLETGLHIGGAASGLDIGGVDNPIIRHPVTREPYIPGSSLRGKMRSLLERAYNLPLNKKVQDVRLHECYVENEYLKCHVCHVFGVSPGERERGVDRGEADRRGEWKSFKPTRLIVRDALLRPDSRAELERADTDLPYTEVKWEASIDRITSAAVPRQNERVPAGAVFGPFEMVYTIYCLNDGDDWKQDAAWLSILFEGMRLLEDDYLGGYGSRGAGKVAFESLSVELRPLKYYTEGAAAVELAKDLDLRDSARLQQIVKQVQESLGAK
jgi:CRISPR-associated protein Csm3